MEAYLYCIHLSVLRKLSPVFDDIFGIPASQPEIEAGREGSVANPVLLEHITKVEIDDFLHWVYRM